MIRAGSSALALPSVIWAALAVAGCSSSPPAPAGPNVWQAPADGAAGASSGLPVERYFPMVDGWIYSYVTMGETGDAGMLMARVARLDASVGELRFPSGTKRFEYTAEGVRISSGANAGSFVLKTPIAVGQTWRGEHGGEVRIDAIDVALELPAGAYRDCLRTVEQRGGDVPARYVTVFCPDVGVVSLEASAGLSFEKAELKSYAAPIDLGPDGVKRVE